MTIVRIAPRIDWDSLSFALTPTRTMFTASCDFDGEWSVGESVPYGDISVSPASGVLNYGQGVFEGTKAYRSARDRVVLFRPEANAERLRQSAVRLCIPPLPEGMFLHSLETVVRENSDFVPPADKGSLYLRPLLWGTGPMLGVRPAPSYTYLVFCSPVGPYFKTEERAIHLKVERRFHRAAPRGIGNAKAIGNYSGTLLPLVEAKREGFDEVLYLNAADEHLVEEVGAANLFIVKGGEVATPRLGGSILCGVTRDSVLHIARDLTGLSVTETNVSLEAVLAADEVFCTGTAAAVTPVARISIDGQTCQIGDGSIGRVTQLISRMLKGIQREERDDPYGWVHPVIGA